MTRLFNAAAEKTPGTAERLVAGVLLVVAMLIWFAALVVGSAGLLIWSLFIRMTRHEGDARPEGAPN